jgi:FSR family fosmidomycin resistance protein-like MFS transporter
MRVAAILRRAAFFTSLLLAIEFLDELVYGAREAAWPLIRDDLALTYAQIGLLLGVPDIFGNLVEPVLGVLADNWRRRVLVLGGGLVFALALLLTAASTSFWPLMIAFMLLSPASGAFVSLSQATLMDIAPLRREQNMARWVLAGSVGVVAGPILLGAFAAAGAGWRVLFAALAMLAFIVVAVAWRQPFPDGHAEGVTGAPSLRLVRNGLVEAVQSLGRPGVLRWLTLLQISDFLQDVLLGFLALYLVDVGQVTPAQAGFGVAVWSGAGLLGDLLLVPLLERTPGLRVVRWTAAIASLLYPLFLLAPAYEQKLALLALLGFFRVGWYAILKAQLYGALPDRSGTALATANLAGLAKGVVVIGLGIVAQRAGLTVTMWLLLLGPVVLFVGLPRARPPVETARSP